MKKNYSFYLSLLAVPLIAILFISFSAGQNGFYVSGAPGDYTEDSALGDCSACHFGSAPVANSSIITLNVPSTYALGQTYNITVSSSSAAARQGFQMSAEASGSTDKVGTFIDDGANNQIFDLGRGSAITHTTTGNSASSWSFQWTAPNTDVGPITFYAAVNETDSSNGTSGDLIHLKNTQSTLSNSTFELLSNFVKLYPNPTSDNYFNIDLPSSFNDTAVVEIYDILGKKVHIQGLIELQSRINVSNWNSGVYLLKISANETTVVKRFVKS